ncbi:MAG: DUF3127 domain-containing protein [Bacteroidales bacterium]|nr:DUF3127 domain-containing protein [Bacteroidales bacterium]
MSLEVTGKVFKILPEVTGEGKNGQWKKQDFVIETEEQYPKKVCMSVWGDKTATLQQLQIGDAVKVGINIDSREYNERWYTDVRAWKIDKISDTAGGSAAAPAMDNLPPMPDDENDLPF